VCVCVRVRECACVCVCVCVSKYASMMQQLREHGTSWKKAACREHQRSTVYVRKVRVTKLVNMQHDSAPIKEIIYSMLEGA